MLDLLALLTSVSSRPRRSPKFLAHSGVSSSIDCFLLLGLTGLEELRDLSLLCFLELGPLLALRLLSLCPLDLARDL